MYKPERNRQVIDHAYIPPSENTPKDGRTIYSTLRALNMQGRLNPVLKLTGIAALLAALGGAALGCNLRESPGYLDQRTRQAIEEYFKMERYDAAKNARFVAGNAREQDGFLEYAANLSTAILLLEGKRGEAQEQAFRMGANLHDLRTRLMQCEAELGR